MVYPANEETFDARVSPEWIKEGHLNSIQALLKRIQDFLGYGGRLHDEGGLVNPVGAIIGFGGTSAPDGWLICDGAEYNGASADYVDLYAIIGKSFGGGVASLFNTPDLRHSFIRGYGSITGGNCLHTEVSVANDNLPLSGNTLNRSGVPVRLTTTDTLPAPLAINTTYYVIRNDATFVQFATTRANAMAGTQINITTQGAGTHTVTPYLEDDESTRVKLADGGNDGADLGSWQGDVFQGHWHSLYKYNNTGRNDGPVPRITSHGANNTYLASDAVRAPVSDGTNGTPRTSKETRPKNLYINHIIKR